MQHITRAVSASSFPMADLATQRHVWKQALEAPFDAEQLRALHAAYHRSLALTARWEALYAEQRAYYLAEVASARQAVRDQHAKTSKADLLTLLGLDPNGPSKRDTRDSLIESLVFAASHGIENEHNRVQRLWPEVQAAFEREHTPL